MNDRFLSACRREPVDRAPVWIMRQAGRYLPEYRELRARHDFMTVCKTPELAVEVSLQPVRRFALDAAIIFSDIILPLEAMGCSIAFDPGPKILSPVRSRKDVDALSIRPSAEVLPFVGEAIALLRRELSGRVPVIGFCGAPFTLAAYLTEGGSRDGFGQVRRLMYEDPDTLRLLLEKLADQMADYLNLQIRSGAQAVQIFDSWAGLLSPSDYCAFALPATQRLIRSLDRGHVPVIHFAVGAGHLIEPIASSGADVIGVCWRTPLSDVRRRTHDRLALQGNLDPHALLASSDTVRRCTREVLLEAGDAPGHIMNLGHGILPETPIASVEAFIETVAASVRVDP